MPNLPIIYIHINKIHRIKTECNDDGYQNCGWGAGAVAVTSWKGINEVVTFFDSF